MASDLVERLRSLEVFISNGGYSPVACEAADRIEELERALTASAATIGAFYQHLERVEAAGGATSISGIATCNTMLKSMRKNANRVEDLIMKPARALLGDLEENQS
jgi:5,10-methenyltetrahydromethanopterin hydrogenase